ncbi:MAG: universal stress protein [Pyrinomonadaceae bacterium]
MKILIAYDGSECAEAALDDLKQAGLPIDAEALVLSVTEAWLPPPPPSSYEIVEEAMLADTPAELQRIHTMSSKAVEDARTLALRARARLQNNFPVWKVTAEATYGSPASEVIRRADEWKPDLIVVGSHGRSALGRFVLGSVSQKVLTESRSSVRVARGRVEVDDSPARIVIGVDGSEAAEVAVREVARRVWPPSTKVRVIIVDEPLAPTLVGSLIPPVRESVAAVNQDVRQLVLAVAERAATELRKAGLAASAFVKEGDPKRVLVAEAEEWGADSIFLGSTGTGSRFERFLLGSVSAAVAARAHCSVEVVRARVE